MSESGDIFGLRREQRILNSGIRDTFTPHKPIDSLALFRGRENEVQRLVEQLNTPGQHALLYGDRGVGKSSLANVVSELILGHLISGSLHVCRCDSETTFGEIVREPLDEVGFDFSSQRVEREREMLSGGLKIPIAEGGGESEKETARTFSSQGLRPGIVAKVLKDYGGMLMVDEADAIPSGKDKKRLAELVKLLSDNGSAFKLFIVGIADTGEELTGAHPSVHRCLKETKLSGMRDDELRSIVVEGAEKHNLRFTDGAVDAIVSLSAGYPHFTHLLALKASEEAIAESRQRIDKTDLRSAMRLAVEDAEGTLKRVYEEAVRSYETDMYRTVLVAAASIGRDEFSSAELRSAVQEITGEPTSQQALNNYFRRLVSNDGETVLWRVAKGVYRFADPRMPSYIRIANQMVNGRFGENG